MMKRECCGAGLMTDGPSDGGCEVMMHLEARPYRPFKSSEEYLYAMKEDLAEWLNNLYGTNITADNFMDELETGVVLCRHANNFSHFAERKRLERQEQESATPGSPAASYIHCPPPVFVYNRTAVAGSFFARDNVHNFIDWCRRCGVLDCLMFETEDLVSRKNERHVILCLLEVARRGAALGMAVPVLVQFELQIDRELARDTAQQERRQQEEGAGVVGHSEDVSMTTDDGLDGGAPVLMYGPNVQVVTNDLKSLDEMVRDLVERCTCPSQFPMIRVSEGKYRIGDTKTLIFVRVLRNHVMVRVGGGWDTLQHFLDKHDPCRCKSGHRSALTSKLTLRTSNGQADDYLGSVMYERDDLGSDNRRTPQPSSRSQSRSSHSPESAGWSHRNSAKNTHRSNVQSPALKRRQIVTTPTTSRESRENLPPSAPSRPFFSITPGTATAIASTQSTPSRTACSPSDSSPGYTAVTICRSNSHSCPSTTRSNSRPLSGGSVRLNRAAAARISTASGVPDRSDETRYGTWSCGDRRRRERPALANETFHTPTASPRQHRRRRERHLLANLINCGESALLHRMEQLLKQLQFSPTEAPPPHAYVFTPRKEPVCPGAVRTRIPAPVLTNRVSPSGAYH